MTAVVIASTLMGILVGIRRNGPSSGYVSVA
jgi:hypothetical protein